MAEAPKSYAVLPGEVLWILMALRLLECKQAYSEWPYLNVQGDVTKQLNYLAIGILSKNTIVWKL